MKAVAANTRFRKRARKCKGSGNVRLSVMKCCVEAGHLRQVWIQLRQRFNTSKVMRLVKRRQRHQLLEICNYTRVHNYGYVVHSPAVDNSVSAGHEEMTGKVALTPAHQEIERLFVACSCLEPLVCDLIAGRILGDKAGLLAEAVDLPAAQNGPASKLALGAEECEFDAG
jgi:hypothetical protein